MNDFKNKILNQINSSEKNIYSSFPAREEYLKLFLKMETINKKINDFKNSPTNFFENFDYEIYDKDYFYEKIDYSKLNFEIPEKSNILTLVNGYFSEENSQIISENISVESLDTPKKYLFFEKHFLDYSGATENQLTSLNSALSKDGLYLLIHLNATVEEPIYIINLITQQDKNYFFNYRKLIVANENSTAKIIEADFFMSDCKSLVMNVFLLKQAQNSNLDYTHIILNRKNNSKVSLMVGNEFKLDANAKLNYNTVGLNLLYGRNRTQFFLEGENAEVNTTLFSYLQNDNTIDVATLIAHLAPNTHSKQVVKSIADDNSCFSFDGKILVEQDAQKIKASQNSRAILLSENASVNCQPQLEIYADDVECSHGSAIGNLEEEMIFYLNSRGIGKEQANKLLFTAFAGEVIDKIPHQNIRDAVYGDLQE